MRLVPKWLQPYPPLPLLGGGVADNDTATATGTGAAANPDNGLTGTPSSVGDAVDPASDTAVDEAVDGDGDLSGDGDVGDCAAFDDAAGADADVDDGWCSDVGGGSSDTFDLHPLRHQSLRRLLALVFERIGEDTGSWQPGSDRWDPQQLLLRPYTGRGLGACKRARSRQAVVLLVDTSPSCEDHARFYSQLAGCAAGYGDVVLYEAPNGHVGNQPVWPFQQRVVVYFGDIDAAEHLQRESHRQLRVYWFDCNPASPHPLKAVFRSRGWYYVCQTPRDLESVLHRLT